MATKVNPIPDGYASVTPYLIVDGGVKALDFYKAAFGATEIMRMEQPNGKLGHAEIRIGNSIIMMADEHPQMGYRGPKALGGTPVSILLYVEDVDTVAAKVVKEGARVLRPVENQFYGDRSGTFEDPFGHVWTVASHVEDIAPEEMKRRVDAVHGDHV
jgi:PhnB protein